MRILPLVLIIFGLTSLGFATDHYICPGATGAANGSEWADAYTGIGTGAGQLNPSSMVRGDTYYIANGQITPASAQTTFGVPDSGASAITLIKAIDGANGTNAGWTNGGTGACNSSQAAFGPILFTTDYWVFNGVTRSTTTGNPWIDWRSHPSYGFYVNNNNGSNAPVVNNTGAIAGGIPGNMAPVNNLTLEYFEVNGSHNGGSGCNLTGTAVDFDAGVWISGGQSYSNYIGYYYIHDVGVSQAILVDGLGTGVNTGTTVEYGWSQNNCVTQAQHSALMDFRGWNGSQANGLTVRYNYLENSDATASIEDSCGCSDVHPSNWAIYGNVFLYNSAEAYANQTGNGDGWLSIYNFSTFGGYLYAFNNTISYLDTPGGVCHHDWGGVSGVTMGEVAFYNNVYYGCHENIVPASCPGSCSSYVDDYNSYFSMNETNDHGAHVQVSQTIPFVNVAQLTNGDNFSLATDTSSWFNTSSLLAANNTDLLGNPRTSSRGALQFGSGSAPPAPPTGLNVVVQ